MTAGGNMKRIFKLIALIMAALITLTACSGNTANEAVTTTGQSERTESAVTEPKPDEFKQIRTFDVKVLTNEVLNDGFRGFGVEWDPHAETLMLDSSWEILLDRVEYLSPQMVRCIVLARWYISSVKDGEVKISFDNKEMRQALKVLDYCQEHGITVVWGDWGPPTNLGVEFDDEVWADAMAKCAEELIVNRGYDCIKYLNIGNEPDGSWSDCGDFGVYAAAVENLHSKLTEYGLTDKVSISGPDVYGDWKWLDSSLERLDDKLGNIDFHWYSDRVNVATGNLEIRLRRKLRDLGDKIGERSIFINEIGLTDDKTAADQQPNVRLYWYGVSIVDFMVQCVRGGASGVIAWDLEDSMHPTGNEYKTWGFWSFKGGADEQNLRPWYYSYSLLTRLFPAGSTILETDTGNEFGVRMLAAKDQQGNLSIAIINNSGDKLSLNLKADTEGVIEKLNCYRYFEDDRPADENGYPVISETLYDVDLSGGIKVTMPEEGIVYFTTKN